MGIDLTLSVNKIFRAFSLESTKYCARKRFSGHRTSIEYWLVDSNERDKRARLEGKGYLGISNRLANWEHV